MVRIRAFQARGPGSIPGRRNICFYISNINKMGAYGVTVSTVDSESTDPGSNPGRPNAKSFWFKFTYKLLLWRNG